MTAIAVAMQKKEGENITTLGIKTSHHSRNNQDWKDIASQAGSMR
jgi:hypothetical protein